MTNLFSQFALAKAALKRNKPFVFDSALLPKCSGYKEEKLSDFNRDHVFQYHKATGWDTQKSDSIHPCYLHMLGFRQHMQLMLADEFPFAMLGIVHLSNKIEQTRPISPSESGTLKSVFEEFERHSKGILGSIKTEFYSEDEVVWSSVSRFLMVDKRIKSNKKSRYQHHTLKDGYVENSQFECDHKMIRQYASVSGDFNPIHLHDLSAKLFGFKSAIAHGMWSKARCLSILQEDCQGASCCDISFNRALFLPAKVKLMVDDSDNNARQFMLVSQDERVVHLSGKVMREG